MKNYILIISSITLIFISCSSKNDLPLDFKFDNVIHYSKNDENPNFKLAFDCNTGEQLEDFGCDIIHDTRPSDLTDISFIDSLKLLGFIKYQIDTSNFNNLRDVFTKKNSSLINSSTACEPIYRDILILKNRDTITGIAKICFECHQKRIIGVSGEQVLNFNFNKLKSILNKSR